MQLKPQLCFTKITFNFSTIISVCTHAQERARRKLILICQIYELLYIQNEFKYREKNTILPCIHDWDKNMRVFLVYSVDNYSSIIFVS